MNILYYLFAPKTLTLSPSLLFRFSMKIRTNNRESNWGPCTLNITHGSLIQPPHQKKMDQPKCINLLQSNSFRLAQNQPRMLQPSIGAIPAQSLCQSTRQLKCQYLLSLSHYNCNMKNYHTALHCLSDKDLSLEASSNLAELISYFYRSIHSHQ